MNAERAQHFADRFLLEREVGRGAAGIVYKAHDLATGRDVALKVVAIPGVDASEEARFTREGRMLASLSHPNIVRLVAFGTVPPGTPYIAMEWLEGEDLQTRRTRAPLSLLQSLEVSAQIADAIAAAHRVGIVHRDIKPSNTFLLAGDAIRVKLVDFGVARSEDSAITQTGAIIGTPAYMAPEQARGDGVVDERADLYSLGATLFELVSGRPPHVGPTPIAVLARLVTTPAPRLSEVVADAPAELDDLLSELLATSKDARPRSAEEVAKRLRTIAELYADAEVDTLRRSLASPSVPPESVTGLRVHDSNTRGGVRLVTTIVGTKVPKGSPKHRLITHLRARGADAMDLGTSAIVAHLGLSRAQGDEAVRALDLGLRIAKLGASVGVATGRARVDRTGARGDVLDRAASLSQRAEAGQVLADTTTTELSHNRYEVQIRGDGASVVAEERTVLKEAPTGAAFVGRDAELALLRVTYERVVDDRAPSLAIVTGAPGMGKSRLRRELLSQLSSHASSPRLLLVRAESFGKKDPLGLSSELFRMLGDIPRGLGTSEAIVASQKLLREAKLGERDAPLLGRLFTPMPEMGASREALWMLMTQVVFGCASHTPLVVAAEDVQWADRESLLWLDHLLARAEGRALFVLLTARPSFLRDGAPVFDARGPVRVDLRPLSGRAVRSIAATILGPRAKDEVAMAHIAEQAGGSPLFAEELSRLVAQGGDVGLAPTIEAALQVQLDLLDEASRIALVRLSAFGAVGWEDGLTALGVSEASEALRRLAAADLVLEHAQSRFAGTREWAFKHALMREVAYASLSEDELRDVHALAAPWLAARGEDEATVARHFELGRDTKRSGEFFERAARRALLSNALRTACAHAEQALAYTEGGEHAFARAELLDEAYRRLDPRSAERETTLSFMQDAARTEDEALRSEFARLHYRDACGGGPETTDDLLSLRERTERLPEIHMAAAALLAFRLAYAGEFERALALTGELRSKGASFPHLLVDAWQVEAISHQSRGEVLKALDARQEAILAARASFQKTREAMLIVNQGFALTALGSKEEARARIVEGLSLANAIGSEGAVRHGGMILLCFVATFGDDTTLLAALDAPRKVADEAASGGWVPHDRTTLGTLFYRAVELLKPPGRQHGEKAETLLRLVVQGYRTTKMRDVLPVALGYWAEAIRRTGDAKLAREVALEAAVLVETGGSLLNEAPIYLSLHDACVDLGLLEAARDAIVRGLSELSERLRGIRGSAYERSFLHAVPANAGLAAAAEGYGLPIS